MHHRIDAARFGAHGASMAHAVEACVHCGFCLPACPTYRVLGEEMDSPRGRIFLMKEVLEGQLRLDEALPYVDRCLGCLACVTACPSGVRYGDLVTPFRAHAEERRPRRVVDRLMRSVVLGTLPYPSRFRYAARLARLARPLQHWLPTQLKAGLALLPGALPPARPLPAGCPAQGPRRARVALLAGCVQQVLAPGIGWAALRVLTRNGVEVVVPRDQGCCGALAMHTGADGRARELAGWNLRAFPHDVDAIVTTAAGCGSAMKEYPLLFAGSREAPDARAFAGHVRDVSEFLDTLGLAAPPPLAAPLRLAYHDACHLSHAQGIRAAPRRLLEAIPDVSLVEFPEPEICCGSAGTYNIDQPQIADALGRRKAEAVIATGAQAIATGNIGCMTQIGLHLARRGRAIPVHHTIEVLDRAYAGQATPVEQKPDEIDRS
jgi:glycolate oxidase iron-sulfur subunit